MAIELDVISAGELTIEDKDELNSAIDKIINQHKQNRQDINKLVFESIAALTEADMAQSELSNKGFFKRLLGNFTGSNQKLQNKINSSKSIAQYASQQTLQKLAEQNLMSFELIAAVINKLNASILDTTIKFNDIYSGLNKFFNYTRSELIQLELRLDKLEQNVKLLNWETSIEYMTLNGMAYSALNDTGKIVCLTRDFFDMTGGNFGINEQNLLKVTMNKIGLNPDQNINLLHAIEEISNNDEFKYKLLGGMKDIYVERPDIYVSFGLLSKIEQLNGDERYIASSVAECLLSKGIEPNTEEIIGTLTSNYMKQLNVNPNNDVRVYDFILELLFNLEAIEELQHIQNNETSHNTQQENISDNTCDNLQEAVQLFLNKESKRAFDIFKKLADEGNGRAAYFTGLYYSRGFNAVQINIDSCLKYWEMGSENSDILSTISLLNLKKENSTTNSIYLSAENKLKELATDGDLFANSLYANQLSLSKDNPEQTIKGFNISLDCAEKGLAVSMNALGKMYTLGIGIEQNHVKAAEWFIKAAEQGDAVAQFNLGNCYVDGEGVEQNYEKAVEWFMKAAEQGHGAAQVNLGNRYKSGKGVKQDYVKGVEWYKKAAEQGLNVAQCNLGNSYYAGEGVEQNYVKAVEWYKKAAEQGHAQAQFNMGGCYYDGRGVDQNYEKAVEWFMKAAEQNYANAQFCLGNCYFEGKGVDLNYEKAFEWYEKAAEHGHDGAKEKINKRSIYSIFNNVFNNIN